MANVFDLVERTNALCKKYERYLEQDKAQTAPERKNGARFENEFEELQEKVVQLEEEGKQVSKVRDRTEVAKMNANIRRAKSELLQMATLLRKTSAKTQSPKAEATERCKKIDALEDRIAAIGDGMYTGRKKPGQGDKKGIFTSLSPKKEREVRLDEEDLNNMNQNPAFYEVTDENREFDQAWQQRKAAQDKQLDVIERGLGNLGNIGTDMNAELRKQDVLLDEMEANMDKATSAVYTNNQKLAGVLKKVRSGRNFCIDLILITILLAVAGYIYTLLR